MKTLRGIDVSKWNGAINWEAVAKAGVQFAMVRAGYGAAKGGFYLDPKFASNVNGAHAAGIPVGVYCYSYARSVDAAAEEARKMLASISAYREKITWPVCYDIEEDAQAKLGTAVCTAMCNAFCDVVREAGYTPMVYCSANWLKNILRAKDLKADVWVAQWAEKDKVSLPHTMWQYTDSGTVAGITGNVDLNIAYKDYAASPDSAEDLPQKETAPLPEAEPKDAADGWAENAWKAAFAKGFLDGTRPKDGVSRQELAVVLERIGVL